LYIFCFFETEEIMKTIFILLVIVAYLCGLGGTQVMAGPFPDTKSQIPILVLTQVMDDQTNLSPNKDMPRGIYHLPHSNVYISDVQGDDDLIAPAILFGLLGVAIAGGVMAGDDKNQVQDFENAITLDIPDIAQQSMVEALNAGAGGRRFALGAASGDACLQIFPYMVYSYAGKEKARLWVILKASLVDYNFNKIEWKCRYIAGLGRPRPFKGPDSWGSLSQVALELEAVQDTQAVVQVMMEDLTGNLRNDNAPQEDINGCWAFYKNPHKATVKVLSSDDREDVVLPQVGDETYFAGVNILPKNFAVAPGN
jgi:hypothetical protein